MDSIKNIMENQAQESQMTFTKECEKHGPYECTRKIYNIGKTVRHYDSTCPKCSHEIEKEQKILRAEQKEKDKMSETKTQIYGTKIPKRYRGIDFDKINPINDAQAEIIGRCSKYINNYIELRKMGTSLVFTGKPGTGKTLIALSMIPKIIERSIIEEFKDYDKDTSKYMYIQPQRFLYVNTYNLFAEIKATYNKDNTDTEVDILNKYIKPELLIVDEVGVQGGTDYEAQMMFRIINSRYEEMKPTFIISNLSETDLSDYIGERVVDRFHENHGTVFVFNWDSYRRR